MATASGLAGAALCVHSSLSSFGRVAGGARAVVDGLLDVDCTVMVPAFSYNFLVAPPPGRRLSRNAWGDSDNDELLPVTAEVYKPACNDIHDSMGTIPAAVVEMKGRASRQSPAELPCRRRPLGTRADCRPGAVGRIRALQGACASERLRRDDGGRPANDDRAAPSRADGGAHVVSEVGERLRRRGRPSGVRGMLAGLQRHRAGAPSCRTAGNRRQQPLAHLPDSRRAGAGVRGDPGECPEITRCAVGGCDRCEDGIEGGCFVRSATSGASPSQARTNSSTTVCLPSSRRPGSSGLARWCRTCLHSRL